ncbi:hypothetical protein LZ31DRAFT_392 [Colletotrichum somersetense]|nr:hypothetical protein LZ31DRAFT_392 [Colletotrichum somersetense]
MQGEVLSGSRGVQREIISVQVSARDGWSNVARERRSHGPGMKGEGGCYSRRGMPLFISRSVPIAEARFRYHAETHTHTHTHTNTGRRRQGPGGPGNRAHDDRVYIDSIKKNKKHTSREATNVQRGVSRRIIKRKTTQ